MKKLINKNIFFKILLRSFHHFKEARTPSEVFTFSQETFLNVD
ncbi:hypothetical protein [Polaribacter reichenbachii]|nr:hypothetical protein [Polaribacter reichenbachii]